MAIDALLMLFSFLLDGGAVAAAVIRGDVLTPEAWFAHGLAALLATVFACRRPLRRRDVPLRWYEVSGVAVMFLGLPVLGLGVWLLALSVMRWFADWRRAHLISWLEPLNGEGFRDEGAPGWRSGFLREQLIKKNTPLDLRLKALMAVRDVPSHYSSNALHGLLGDECDDVRLLACGILEMKEKTLDQCIYRAQQRFQRHSDSDEAPQQSIGYIAARELAELYWEQVYQGLAQGDARLHALARAERYVQEALHDSPADGGLRTLQGRISLLGEDHQKAEAAFTSALALGFPAARVEPYLAELAFLQHDYAGVRRIMAHMKGSTGALKVRQAALYWR